MTKYNVIVIVVDGLRSDRLNICPNFINILRSGSFFSNMITSAPYTLASFYSLITGLNPSKHGVNSYFNMFKFKKRTCKTLMQYMHDTEYYTEASLFDDSMLPSEGFDTFGNYDEHNTDIIKLHKDIITKVANKKFFLFLHYNELHTKGVINVARKYADFDKEFFDNYESNKKKYNSWLKDLDLYTKEIYDHLKKKSLLDNTILIFLSDHGTSNGEKIGERMYGCFTYDYTIRIFCSFIVPNIIGKEIGFQTRLIDILPTLFDFLKIDADESYEHIQGKSLIPFIRGEEKEDRIAFSETGGLYGPWPSHYEHNVFCVRAKKWKLIYNKTPNGWEMYDLENDSEEKNNLFDKNKNKEITLKLKEMLVDHIKSSKGSFDITI